MTTAPTITVCIPTFNRAEALERAIASVLAQTHSDLELLISDNASTDDTQRVCREACAADSRVRVIRQQRNVGLTANFNSLFEAARGRYVMALADDDWLAPDYVELCLDTLADPAVAVASGHARYWLGSEVAAEGVDVQIVDAEPQRRVLHYLAVVRDNASIYGVMRTDELRDALPLRNCLAGDWLLISRLAMRRAIVTVPETCVNRSADGASASFERTVRSMGLTAWEARHPHLAIAGFVHADIARDASAYEPLGKAGRRRLALRAWWTVLRHRPLNVIDDALRPYLSRPRMRRVDDVLRRLARRIQT